MIRISETIAKVAHQAKEEAGMDETETEMQTAVAIVHTHMTFG